MVAIEVRRGSETATIHADTVSELYTNTARHFHISDELTLRLVFRARVLQRTDTFSDLHMTDGSVVVMTVGSNTPAPPHGSSNTNASANHSVPLQFIDPTNLAVSPLFSHIQNVVNQVMGSLGGNDAQSVVGGSTFVVDNGNMTQVFPEAGPPPPTTDSASQPPVEGVPLASSPEPSGSAQTSPPIVTHRVNLVQRQPPPQIAGVYLHLHVNMDELDSVPVRLAQLQQRVNPSSVRLSFPLNLSHLPPVSPSGNPGNDGTAPSAPTSTAPFEGSAGRSAVSAAEPLPFRQAATPSSALSAATSERAESEELRTSAVSISSILNELKPVFDSIAELGFDLSALLDLYLSGDSSVLFPHRASLLEKWNLLMATGVRQLINTFVTQNRSSFGLTEDHQLEFTLQQVIEPWLNEWDATFKAVMSVADGELEITEFRERFNAMLRRYSGGLLYFLSQLPLSSSLSEIFERVIRNEPLVPDAIKNLLSFFLDFLLSSLASSYNSTSRLTGDPVLLSLPAGVSPAENSSPQQLINDNSLSDLADSLINSEEEDSPQGNVENSVEETIPEVISWGVVTGNEQDANSLHALLIDQAIHESIQGSGIEDLL